MDEADVVALLQQAGAAVHQDPALARQLAARARAAAPTPVLRAQADYVLGQLHALSGDLDSALTLVEQARRGFSAAGADFEAVRTQLGRIHVLNEQGRYEAAVAVGRTVLADLDRQAPWQEDPVGARNAQWLRATVHRNLASSYALTGRHARALQEGRVAEQAYAGVGTPEELAAVQHHTAELLLDLGRGRESLAALEQARTAFAGAGHTLSEARCLVALGRAQVLLGRWTPGLAALARARVLLEQLDVRPELDQLLITSAETWLQLGLHDEALVSYGEAEQSLRRPGQPHYLARVLAGTGAALARAGRPSDAHLALGEAAELYRAAGNLPMLAQVVLESADVHAQEGALEQARACAQEALHLTTDAPWALHRVYARLRSADLALPDLDAAEKHLVLAAQLTQELGLLPLRYRVDARLGHVQRLAGRVPEARACLSAATAVVEQLRAGLPSETLRTSFLRDAAAPYADLVALELDAGDPRAALDAAERSKSRGLVDLLVAPAGPATDAPVLDADLRQALGAAYNNLLAGPDPAVPAQAQARRQLALRRRVAEMEATLREEALRAHAELADSGAHPVPVGTPLPVAELLAALPPDLAVLAFHVVGPDVVAFVLFDGEVRGVREVTVLSRVRDLLRQLDAQWQRFRSPELVQRHRERLAALALRLLQELYDELLRPLGDLPGADRLVVVAHGPLHEVPFHALHDGEQWLVERYQVSSAPSVSVLVTTLRRPAARGPALVLGVADEAAHHVADEARAVAAELPGARLHAGERATSNVLREQAPGSAVVHVACHGLFRPDSPAYSSLRLGDGWLTAAQLLEVDLTGALVALTACETGRSRAHGAGDEILGLTRAALGAGAATVLVSLWLVQDDVAADLVAQWYSLMQRGKGPGAALRDVQLALARRGEHPYFWAPFVLVGAPGPPTPVRPEPVTPVRSTT